MTEGDKNSHDYEMGLRDGRIKSLEIVVGELAIDVKKMKLMLWALYGAIGLVQFLPELKDFLSAAS